MRLKCEPIGLDVIDDMWGLIEDTRRELADIRVRLASLESPPPPPGEYITDYERLKLTEGAFRETRKQMQKEIDELKSMVNYKDDTINRFSSKLDEKDAMISAQRTELRLKACAIEDLRDQLKSKQDEVDKLYSMQDTLHYKELERRFRNQIIPINCPKCGRRTERS